MRVSLALCCTAVLVLMAGRAAVADDMEEGWRAYVRGDFAKARDLFVPLVEQGNPRAMSVLASMYRFGDGVELDPERSVRLYRQAAALGYVPAQYDLAQLYLVGFGVEQSVVHAIMWLTVALDLVGYEKPIPDSGFSTRQPITEFRQNVVSQASFFELAQALDMAATCRKSKFTACE